MNRENTRSGLAADIGAAASYSNQYYYGTDTGVYYYSDGTSWAIKTFDTARSVYNRAGTITTGNTAQLVAPAATKRKWLFFQNLATDADMYLGIGYIPTTSNGMFIARSGGNIRFEVYVPSDAIYVLCASSSKAFVCLEGF
jgi:hypothetical protein